LTGSFSAGGTVTYEFFTGSTCAGTATTVGTPVTVTGGVVPNSASQAFNSAGSFSWNAVYSGDANNNGATSPCEPLTVNKTSPTIATTLSSASITVGTSVTDSAALAGSFQAGGTVTYSFFTNGICTAPGTVASTVTVTGGVVPNSRAVTFNATGSFSFQAVYSGDANNNGATSSCEPLTVNKTNPTIATTLSATTITVGGSVSDSSVLTGSFSAGGTVTYNFFTGGTCAGTATVVSTVTVTSGVVPNSAAHTFATAGAFSWNAVYSGDANNNGATSPCEPLTVNKASPTIATTLSATTITVGSSVTDSSALTGSFSAGGTVTYEFFSGSTCTGTATAVGTPVTVTGGVVPNSASQAFNSAGSFSWNAVYSGDANNNGATSPCEPLTVNKASPTIATTLSATTIAVGSSVTDSSVLTGSFSAGGTVTYEFFTGSTCTGTATTVGTPVTVTGGVVPNSASQAFNSAGSFSWNAVYSGDANNNGATSLCEPLTVNKASPTIATTLSATSITVGGSVSDSSVLTGSFSAAGTVTYNFFTGGTCAGTATVVSTVTVTGGVVPSSAAQTFSTAGAFSWNAVYSGDANNNGATSPCEPLTVNKASPTIATTLSATTITVGSSVTDSSVLTGSFSAGGTVTYEFFAGSTCTGTATAVGTPVTVTGGVVPNSASQAFNSAGAFSWNAVYSGDANNNGATSPCEPLTVNKTNPTIATTLSATTITVGSSVSDSATLTGSFQAGGTVTYEFFTGSTCTGTATTVGTPVTVTGGVVPNSASQAFNSAGAFSWNAVYSGDANNNGSTSPCEPLTVNKTTPTIATTLSATTITVGGSVSDSSVLTGSFQAGGTVTYQFFAGSTCAGTATTVGTPVTVTGGVVPNSASQTFNAAGSFSWNAVYSGDANNNGATSPCEPLTVSKASPTIATTLSATSIHAGQTVTDSSTMASFFQAGGTVTYNLFTNGACTAPGSAVSTVTVTNGIVPNSRAVLFNATGSFSFNAVYSGDANNNAATSACEPLSVVTGVTISTTLSSTTPVVGTTVTDSATLQFQTATAGGTVTYTDFANSACAAPGTVVSTVIVTNGVVPNSRAVVFNATGSFSFQASYSGDANNNAATSACEPLTVQKASPTITTTLSATTITVGASVTDSSTMASFFQAGGTVTYNFFTGGTCAGTATVVSTVAVTGGVVPNSAAHTFSTAGAFSWNAVYSGDANNNAATSPCEPLTVNKASPTIATTLSATTITVGSSVTDSSALTGSFSAGGTVTYNFFTGGTCAGTATVVSTVTVTGGVVPNSASQAFNSAGAFSWNAVYSGDANNNGATSPCEPLTVNKTSPTIATTLSATTITVGGSVSDSSVLTGSFSAGGTVTYNFFTGGTCAGTATVVSTVTVTSGVVPNSASQAFNSAGSFSWNAVYSGDANNNGATSPCEPLTVNKASPTIATTLSATTITVGSSVTDSSVLTGSFSAGGTVTYEFFTGSTCTGTATTVGTPVTVTGGVVPNSASQAFNSAGAFSWNAVYSGDANNNGATSPCEPLTVNKATAAITTTLSATTISVGQSVTDSAALTGSFQASGSVNYNLFVGSGTCTGTSSTVSTVTVTAGVVPNSRSVLFNATNAGGYSFQAVYSGDANNNGSTSPCEPLTVNPAGGVTITTTLSATTITVGGSVFDSATLAGTTATAGGTVTYNTFTTGTCSGTATVVSTVTVTNAVVPNSASKIFSSAGSVSWNAVYSGDANNGGATSVCEPLTVNKASPTIATTLSATTITVGSSVTDSSVLTSSFSAGGTVTYEFFTGSTCAGTATTVGTPVTVTGGVVPNSASQAFNSAGSFSWNAVYSGDANNNGATSPCEPLTVQKTSPTIATTLSATTITVGGSVSDSSVLTGSFSASGTVTYNFFTGGTCAGTATVVSTVTVTGGVVPNSAAHTFSTAGAFSWNAVYSGDANNNGATSPCEPLTVNKASPTIATTLSATTISVGQSVTDSAALTGSFQAGGSVNYNLFIGSGTCAGTSSTVSTVTVTGGVVPNSRSVLFNATNAGGYSFQAVYSGDANNNAATSPCEPLTVNPAGGVTITTTLSATTITVGGSVSDSATLSGATATAGGTVTYNLFTTGTCTGTSTVISTVTVTNSVVPNSASHAFTLAGAYSWNAVYSGDANNAGATSVCEPLTVNKASPTIATTLSATTITVGGSVSDSSVLTGSFSAAGTVTYNFFTGGTCAGTATVVSTVTVTGGVVPNSASQTFNSAGAFSWNAVYSGDANNNGATSPCEPLTVNKTTPTLATTLSSTSITVGASVTDSAALTGSFSAGGTVTYEFFTGSTCTGTATTVGTPVTVTGGVVPNSASQAFNSAGSFSWNAVYSGDANNNGATSACEPLTVNKASPTITTSLSATSIRVNQSVTDSATLTTFFQASGTVTYSVFTNGLCTAPGTAVSTVTVTGGVVPNSRAVTFNATGSYSFQAVYSGDANNNGATSACEPLTVATGVTITTTLSATTVTIGASVTDSATLSGQTAAAGGTVTYNEFANGTCSAPGPIAMSTVTVTNGVVPNSGAFPTNRTGSFSFQAAYSGDANNNGATSPCEPFTVNMTTPTLTTTVSATSVVLGSSVFDTATLSGSFNAGGTVTYTLYNGGTCSGTGSAVGSPVTVTGGVVPNSASLSPTTATTYSFRATYSGDANNNAATSACEPFNVTDFTITASTTSVSVNAGDTATVTITVAPINGFTGTVILTPNPSAGLTATILPGSIVGGSGTATLTVSSPVAGTYMVTVTGMSGPDSHITPTITVQVVDFQIFASPATINTTPGVAGTTSIMIVPLNGFTGTVTLSYTVSPAGPICTFTPSMIMGGSGSSTLSCTGSGGTFIVTVTGTTPSISGTAMLLSHNAMVTLNVTDFTLTSCTPQPVVVNQGSMGSCTITVTPVGGFTGTVTLSFTNNGTITSMLSPTTITISGTATLTVTTTTSTPVGVYVFNVTGASPGLSHSTPASFKVISQPTCPQCAPPDMTQMQWTHRLSISKTGGVQTWKFGISNGPAGSNNVTIYVNVRITITDGSFPPVTLNSGVLTLGPGKNLVNQQLSTTFNAGEIGTTFSWSVSIQWGTSPTALTQTTFTDTTGVPTSGSFTVLS
jgi:hypothetical protein